MSRGNCVAFAVRLYLRRARKGKEGYLLWRRSRICVFSGHMLYAERRANGTFRVVHYYPARLSGKGLPPAWFDGLVRWGDR